MKSLSHVQLLVTPMDRSPPGSSVHGIFQARVLEWGAISFYYLLYIICCCCSVAKSCLTFSNPKDCSLPGSSIHGLSRQEYWSGVPSPSPIHKAMVGKRVQNFHTPLELTTRPVPLHIHQAGTSLDPISSGIFFSLLGFLFVSFVFVF